MKTQYKQQLYIYILAYYKQITKFKYNIILNGATSMFIAALVTTAKLWKHPRCPTPNEHSGILLSHKKEWNFVIYK
jgi:hypothetical protein